MRLCPMTVLAASVLSGMLGCAPDAVLVDQGEPLPPPCKVVYSTVPQDECDPFLHDCEGSERCVVTNDGNAFTTICSPSFGGKGAGEACSLPTECDTSLTCALGFCSPVCCPANNEPCGEGGYCVGKQRYDDYLVFRCLYGDLCELFVPDACADPANACRFIPAVGAAICMPPHGASQEGQYCSDYDDCGEAEMCYALSGSSGVCRYNCQLASSTTLPPGSGGCPTGQECADLNLGLEDVGVCTP